MFGTLNSVTQPVLPPQVSDFFSQLAKAHSISLQQKAAKWNFDFIEGGKFSIEPEKVGSLLNDLKA